MKCDKRVSRHSFIIFTAIQRRVLALYNGLACWRSSGQFPEQLYKPVTDSLYLLWNELVPIFLSPGRVNANVIFVLFYRGCIKITRGIKLCLITRIKQTFSHPFWDNFLA